tara:strand:- start:13541 stop:13966 length:426 start_codon:yes stop_codon:yes gene_type:complete
MKRNNTLIESYKEYIEENKNIKVLQVEYPLYREVCTEFNEKIADRMLREAYEFKLPFGLGTLRIKKTPSKDKKRVDWKTTKEYNTKIFHLNLHTDGFYYRWHWKKKDARVVNKSLYSFTPTRKNKRQLAGLLKTNDVEFFE